MLSCQVHLRICGAPVRSRAAGGRHGVYGFPVHRTGCRTGLNQGCQGLDLARHIYFPAVGACQLHISSCGCMEYTGSSGRIPSGRHLCHKGRDFLQINRRHPVLASCYPGGYGLTAKGLRLTTKHIINAHVPVLVHAAAQGHKVFIRLPYIHLVITACAVHIH